LHNVIKNLRTLGKETGNEKFSVSHFRLRLFFYIAYLAALAKIESCSTQNKNPKNTQRQKERERERAGRCGMCARERYELRHSHKEPGIV